MTVIAWDGETLAADRMAECGTHTGSVSKIHKFHGELIGVAGVLAVGQDIIAWYRNCGDPNKYPRDIVKTFDTYTAMVVITRQKEVHLYDVSGYPLIIEDRFFALGSGALGAMCVMECGKSAYTAVKTVQLFDSGCGNGVDYLTLDGDKN